MPVEITDWRVLEWEGIVESFVRGLCAGAPFFPVFALLRRAGEEWTLVFVFSSGNVTLAGLKPRAYIGLRKCLHKHILGAVSW
jgi:hypothetical protein